MRKLVAAWIGIMGLSLCVVAMASGQEPVRGDEAPAPIPVAEVTLRAEEVGTLLRTLQVQLPPDAQVIRIEAQLPALSERLTERFDRTRRAVESQPGLGALDALANSWRASRSQLDDWLNHLTTRAVWLDQQRKRLAGLEATWSQTRQALGGSPPRYLIERVDAVQSSLATAQDLVKKQETATLHLQNRVAREAARCEETLVLLGQARQRAAANLFVLESKPIWSAETRNRAAAELPGLIGASIDAQHKLLRQFVADQVDRIVVHGGIILGFVVLFWWARRRVLDWRTRNRPAGSLATVFEHPVPAALVLGLPAGVWLYTDAPTSVRTLIEIAMLLPVVMVLRRLLPPAVLPGLYLLAAFFLADRLRDLAAILPLLERVLFLVEMLGAATLLGWALWSGRARDLLASDDQSVPARLRMAVAGLAFGGFVIAFVAGAIGSMSLARLLGSAILASGYLALALTATRRLMQGLVSFALRVKPLTLLRMVEHHRDLLEQRAHVALRVLAVGAWAVATLDFLGLLAPVSTGGRAILTAELTQGALRISIGDVLAFAITIYAAFLFSSLVRFVLEEDVFPRLHLSAGLPYALSSVFRYCVIFVGFILALLALGVNLDRVTVLGGAFGIGVGFGLQNIVNNFVSGLIVLFERPIRVGDAVQIGDVQGEVRRIGIRSSTVRTWEGAEVIVPNSQLVADKVTNWTPAQPRRRIDIAVGVAYGTAPDKVLKVLGEVAHAHPDVAADPAPQALFLGFGDSALRFELRVWTRRLDRHVAVKSELGIAVYAALREAGMTIPLPQQEIRVVSLEGAETPSKPPHPREV